jgi:hypothetical protein
MNKLIKVLLVFALFGIVFQSCDYIEEPYERNPKEIVLPNRNVLLENYTGHLCESQPVADVEANNLRDTYSDRLSIVNIHAGSYAQLESPLYETDLTTVTGNELDNEFNVTDQGCALGMISRIGSGNSVFEADGWNDKIDSLTKLTTIASLKLTNDYDEENRILNLSVETEFFESTSNVFKLSVFITEDSIQSTQRNSDASIGPVPDWDNYFLRDVLRGAVSPTWGNELNTGEISVNDKISVDYHDFVVPDEWKDWRCNIIAFVYDEASYEIVQVKQIRLVDTYEAPNIRKVFLEDYTGHRCVTCPAAAVVAHDLKEQYEDQLIVMSVHAGFFAEPLSAPFDADFRTEAGTEYFNYFEVEYPPRGMVNRVGEGLNRVLGATEWAAAIGTEVAKDAEAYIEIISDYNSSNRSLSTSLKVSFFSDLPGIYKVCAVVLEDSIIAPQKSNPDDIMDYVHMHMLRGNINGTWGSIITGDNIVAGSEYEVQLPNYDIDAEWDDQHCNIVAFVFNEATLEIIQAEEVKLVE